MTNDTSPRPPRGEPDLSIDCEGELEASEFLSREMTLAPTAILGLRLRSGQTIHLRASDSALEQLLRLLVLRNQDTAYEILGDAGYPFPEYRRG